MTGMLLAKPIGEVSDMTRHETSQTLVCVYRRRLCIRRKHIMTKDAFIREVRDAEAMLYHISKSILKNDSK